MAQEERPRTQSAGAAARCAACKAGGRVRAEVQRLEQQQGASPASILATSPAVLGARPYPPPRPPRGRPRSPLERPAGSPAPGRLREGGRSPDQAAPAAAKRAASVCDEATPTPLVPSSTALPRRPASSPSCKPQAGLEAQPPLQDSGASSAQQGRSAAQTMHLKLLALSGKPGAPEAYALVAEASAAQAVTLHLQRQAAQAATAAEVDSAAAPDAVDTKASPPAPPRLPVPKAALPAAPRHLFAPRPALPANPATDHSPAIGDQGAATPDLSDSQVSPSHTSPPPATAPAPPQLTSPRKVQGAGAAGAPSQTRATLEGGRDEANSSGREAEQVRNEAQPTRPSTASSAPAAPGAELLGSLRKGRVAEPCAVGPAADVHGGPVQYKQGPSLKRLLRRRPSAWEGAAPLPLGPLSSCDEESVSPRGGAAHARWKLAAFVSDRRSTKGATQQAFADPGALQGLADQPQHVAQRSSSSSSRQWGLLGGLGRRRLGSAGSGSRQSHQRSSREGDEEGGVSERGPALLSLPPRARSSPLRELPPAPRVRGSPRPKPGSDACSASGRMMARLCRTVDLPLRGLSPRRGLAAAATAMAAPQKPPASPSRAPQSRAGHKGGARPATAAPPQRAVTKPAQSSSKAKKAWKRGPGDQAAECALLVASYCPPPDCGYSSDGDRERIFPDKPRSLPATPPSTPPPHLWPSVWGKLDPGAPQQQQQQQQRTAGSGLQQSGLSATAPPHPKASSPHQPPHQAQGPALSSVGEGVYLTARGDEGPLSDDLYESAASSECESLSSAASPRATPAARGALGPQLSRGLSGCLQATLSGACRVEPCETALIRAALLAAKLYVALRAFLLALLRLAVALLREGLAARS